MSASPRKCLTYSSWMGMKGRCLNPNHADYPRYGGRGIGVCDRWASSYDAFLEDMGPRPSRGHSIDRIDNGGGYDPGNCRWALQKEQCRNKRTNVFVEDGGQRVTIAEFLERRGIRKESEGYSTYFTRISKCGWDPERAVSEPIRPQRRRVKREWKPELIDSDASSLPLATA